MTSPGVRRKRCPNTGGWPDRSGVRSRSERVVQLRHSETPGRAPDQGKTDLDLIARGIPDSLHLDDSSCGAMRVGGPQSS